MRTVTLGDTSKSSESLLLLLVTDRLVGLLIAAFKVKLAVLLLSILAILSIFDSLLVAGSKREKLVQFIMICFAFGNLSYFYFYFYFY